jgi:hypothetical protein
MVEQLRAVPSVPLLAAAPQQYLLFGLTNGHSGGHSPATTETSVLTEEDPVVPAGETIDSLVRPLVESAKAAPAAPPPPPKFVELPAPLRPPESSAPLIESRTPTAAQPPAITPPVAQPSPFLARVAQIAALRIPADFQAKTASPVESGSPTAKMPAASPPPKTEPAGLPVSAVKMVELPVPPNPPIRIAPLIEHSKLKPAKLDPAKLAIAPPAPRAAQCMPEPSAFPAPVIRIAGLSPALTLCAKTAPRIPAATLAAAPPPPAAAAPKVTEPGLFASTKPQLPKLATVAEPFCAAEGFRNQSESLSEAFELQAKTILDEIQLGLDADESKIRGIAATFEARPKLALLPAPSDILAAPAPPDLQWLKTPRPVLPASKPFDRKCASLIAPPQKLPLAGPCLPPELRNYIEAPLADDARSKKGIGVPAWIISLVIATSLFLVAAIVLQFLAANREAKAAVAPSPSQAAASVPAAPAFEQHPFARFVEVTGVRVVADLSHRSQVQYIVVNHSSEQLSGMLIRIAVRSSADPAGAKPLFTVSAVIPSLGPHQSKEIRTDLDSQLRSSAIPDWEYLRTDVQVGTQN